MVDISHENPEQTRARLGRVLGLARFVVLPGGWSFSESPLADPPALDASVLAAVRDDERWSWLSPAEPGAPGSAATEVFALGHFDFPAGVDNSGFVGWLAGELKLRLGTGVIVICCANSERGGIHDYWGWPIELGEEVPDVIRELGAGIEHPATW